MTNQAVITETEYDPLKAANVFVDEIPDDADYATACAMFNRFRDRSLLLFPTVDMRPINSMTALIVIRIRYRTLLKSFRGRLRTAWQVIEQNRLQTEDGSPYTDEVSTPSCVEPPWDRAANLRQPS